jgi:hypothetical protein
MTAGMRAVAIAAVAVLLGGCAEARAKRALAERESREKVARGERNSDGDFTCETMTLTGTHVPKMYCYYDDEDAQTLARIKMQTSLITSEVTCPADAPGCPRSIPMGP